MVRVASARTVSAPGKPRDDRLVRYEVSTSKPFNDSDARLNCCSRT